MRVASFHRYDTLASFLHHGVVLGHIHQIQHILSPRLDKTWSCFWKKSLIDCHILTTPIGPIKGL